MKDAFKLVSTLVFGAALVAAPIAFGVEGSLGMTKAFAEGAPNTGATTDTGVPNTGPTADTGVPNTGPGGESGGGGGPVMTVATKIAAAVVGRDTGVPNTGPTADTGIPNTGPDADDALVVTSLYN